VRVRGGCDFLPQDYSLCDSTRKKLYDTIMMYIQENARHIYESPMSKEGKKIAALRKKQKKSSKEKCRWQSRDKRYGFSMIV
jgi:ribosomal protein S21